MAKTNEMTDKVSKVVKTGLAGAQNKFSLGYSVMSSVTVCTRETLEAARIRADIQKKIEQIEDKMASWNETATMDEKKKLKDEISALKKMLAIFTPHACFTNGKRKVETDPVNYTISIWASFDLDYLDDPVAVWNEKIAPLAKKLRIVWAYISPSLHGLKIIFMRPANLDVRMAQRWFANQVGIEEYDDATYDLARCSFINVPKYDLLYDPDTLFDENLTNEGYTVDVDASILLEAIEDDETKHTDLRPIGKETLAPREVVVETVEEELPTHYNGIPYADIVKRYWEQECNGVEPSRGDRNTKTYELALALRHICDFNARLLDVVIPNYDGFPQDEKKRVIERALNANHYSMPQKLKSVLASFKAENAQNIEIVHALDEVEEKDQTVYIVRILECFARYGATVPRWMNGIFEGVQKTLHMPVLLSSTPCIGGLATGVELLVHDEPAHLTLCVIPVGEAASGKSKVGGVYRLWCHKLAIEDDINFAIMEQWKALPKKEREKSSRPVVKVRLQPLRCSQADVLAHLNTAEGKHLISFTDELDQLTQTRRSGAYADVSVLIRLSYGGEEYKSSFAGENAVNANIKQVNWNMVMCTTSDGLYRAITNVTDGELTRIGLLALPDNTYQGLSRVKPRSAEAENHIKRIAVLLELLSGTLDLPLLEDRNNEWLEAIRLETLQNDDKVKARQRMRTSITAQRMLCCIMLASFVEWLIDQLDDREEGTPIPAWADGATTAEQYLLTHTGNWQELMVENFQKPEYLDCYDIIADYLMENTLYYFRERIEKAYASANYSPNQRQRQGKNDTVYESLGKEFSLEEARQAKQSFKGEPASDNEARQMVKNWKSAGMVEPVGFGRYKKLK